MNKKILTLCIALLSAITLGLLSTNCSGNSSDDEVKTQVIGKLKACSELVTTKIELKVVPTIIVDNGKINLNPETWELDRIGKAVVILPVYITVEYGYNLDSMQVDIVKTADDESEVWVYLPDSRIIDSTYDPKVSADKEVITSGSCPEPTEGQIEKGMKMAYHEALEKFDDSLYKDKVEQNAQLIFENILKATDYKITKVHIANLKDRR